MIETDTQVVELDSQELSVFDSNHPDQLIISGLSNSCEDCYSKIVEIQGRASQYNLEKILTIAEATETANVYKDISADSERWLSQFSENMEKIEVAYGNLLLTLSESVSNGVNDFENEDRITLEETLLEVKTKCDKNLNNCTNIVEQISSTMATLSRMVDPRFWE